MVKLFSLSIPFFTKLPSQSGGIGLKEEAMSGQNLYFPLKADPTDFMADLDSWESVILNKTQDELVFHLLYHFRPSRHGAYRLITMTFYMKEGEIDHALLYMKHGSKPGLDMYCKYYS